MAYWKIILASLLALGATAAEPILTCEPRSLHGVPGEPLSLQLTVVTQRATPIQIHIPSVSNLVLRTVEKIPIQRNAEGRFIQKRRIIWQGIQAGNNGITNLTVTIQPITQTAAPRSAKTPTIEKTFPAVKVSIATVEPASPPPVREAVQ